MSNNTRERELTKHVSLAQLNPMALLELIENGSCEISIPEVIFDLDYPGHYFRRIKSVSLTIPAVTGPYTTLGCTLTLTNSSVRQVADLGIDPVPESVGVSQAIATSSGQSDSGLFLLDFSDERYLPFEGAGVISTWQLKLTDPALAQFSYDLISDVIFHIHYTARENEVFRDTVETKLKMDIDALLETAGVLTQMISVRSTFPDAWARLLAAEDTAGSTLSLDLTQDLFPYLISQHEIKVIAFDFLVNNVDTPNNPTDYGSVSVSFPTNVNAGSAFEKSLEMPSLAIGNLDLGGEKNLGQWDFDLSAGVVAKVGAEIDDIVLLCHYKLR